MQMNTSPEAKETLINVFNLKSQQALSNKEISAKANSHDMRSNRILMIEDDIDMAGLVRHSLVKKYGFHVDIAPDPFEAMNLMNEHFYNLILLDWNLPELNGGETLEKAASAMAYDPLLPIQWDFQEVPVVVFSSEKRTHCMFNGTKHFNYKGFVSKTQPLKEIINTISYYIDSNLIKANLAILS